jgi:hypothetical protein
MGKALLALVVFIGVSAYFLLTGSNASPTRSVASVDQKSVFEQFKSRVAQALNNSDAMNYTVERNPNAFACLSTSDGNCEAKTAPVFIFEKRDVQSDALSQIHPEHGLALDTMGCTGFPSKDCPIRIEAVWRPVCSPPQCEFTKSFYLKVKLLYQEGAEATPTQATLEQLITPDLKLSAAVSCAREKGIYDGLTCRRPGDTVAAPSQPESQPNINSGSGLNEPVAPQQEPTTLVAQFACPETITINGNQVQVDATMAAAKVEIPTSAGCNGQGFDSFTFQCIEKTPATFDGEGQWAQIGAQLAPPCDQDNRPMENGSPSL